MVFDQISSCSYIQILNSVYPLIGHMDILDSSSL